MTERLISLPAGLWAGILSHIFQSILQARDPDWGDCVLDQARAVWCANNALTALQVCREFNDIFLQTPQWFELLFLPAGSFYLADRAAFTESLLIWVGKHKQKVQHLVSVHDPIASLTVLDALICARSQLSRIHVQLPITSVEVHPTKGVQDL